MLKAKNPTKEKEIDTEFWLEEDRGEILLKAKLVGQERILVIASINKKGIYLWRGMVEGWGFEIKSDKYENSYIDIQYS